jgi:hypothetical protein
MAQKAKHHDCLDIAPPPSNGRRMPQVSNASRHLKCEEAFMGAVMIKCPDTGRDIATGIVADRASFNAMPVFFARVYCPVCRTEHEWFAQQAWVCDSEPPAQPHRTQLS